MEDVIGGTGIFALALLALVAWGLWSTIKIVPQGFTYPVETTER